MSPYFLLSILLGGVYGAAFHTWQGKSLKDIVYYLFAGIIGFGMGQAIASFFDWELFLIGPLHIVEASICCWLVLFIARWLRV